MTTSTPPLHARKVVPILCPFSAAPQFPLATFLCGTGYMLTLVSLVWRCIVFCGAACCVQRSGVTGAHAWGLDGRPCKGNACWKLTSGCAAPFALNSCLFACSQVADKIVATATGGFGGCGHAHGLRPKQGPAADSCCAVEVLAGEQGAPVVWGMLLRLCTAVRRARLLLLVHVCNLQWRVQWWRHTAGCATCNLQTAPLAGYLISRQAWTRWSGAAASTAHVPRL